MRAVFVTAADAEAEEFAGSGDQCGVLECGPLATCQTVAGALRCVCRPGYTGDAPNCTGIVVVYTAPQC